MSAGTLTTSLSLSTAEASSVFHEIFVLPPFSFVFTPFPFISVNTKGKGGKTKISEAYGSSQVKRRSQKLMAPGSSLVRKGGKTKIANGSSLQSPVSDSRKACEAFGNMTRRLWRER
ncbi:hypothetical protein NE237_032025 [Protea cynaroides]|uniref:Uncharacterized protein n=1 Tax=Protea cynaroides TaxID=273540 RepID=A0A9Q0L2B9_9MAGN|nr:hypothetical protein NE237_032025 [Protea cynaroides]